MTRGEGLLDLAVRGFRLHLLIYLMVGFLALVLAAVTGWRWLSWPMLVWAVLLLAHYLVYKTRTVDERWVEERVEELDLKSYDRDHIQSIRAQHGGDDIPRKDQGRR